MQQELHDFTIYHYIFCHAITQTVFPISLSAPFFEKYSFFFFNAQGLTHLKASFKHSHSVTA